MTWPRSPGVAQPTGKPATDGSAEEDLPLLVMGKSQDEEQLNRGTAPRTMSSLVGIRLDTTTLDLIVHTISSQLWTLKSIVENTQALTGLRIPSGNMAASSPPTR